MPGGAANLSGPETDRPPISENAAAIILGAVLFVLPLLLFCGVFFLQYMLRQRADIVGLNSMCYIVTVERARYPYLSRKFFDCKELGLELNAAQGKYHSHGAAAEVTLQFTVFGTNENYLTKEKIYDGLLQQALTNGFVWIARMNGPDGNVTFIENWTHGFLPAIWLWDVTWVAGKVPIVVFCLVGIFLVWKRADESLRRKLNI